MISFSSPGWRQRLVRYLLLGFFFYLLGQVLTRLLPVRTLTVDDGIQRADVAIVLGGSTDRPLHAADLYRQGLVKWVLLSGQGDIDVNDAILREKGVPARAILQDRFSSSTLLNAKFSVALMQQHGLHSALVVTSWYHSRRALRCFARFARPGMIFYSAPSYWGCNSVVPDQSGINQAARYEYLKLIFYRYRYGIGPCQKEENPAPRM